MQTGNMAGVLALVIGSCCDSTGRPPKVGQAIAGAMAKAKPAQASTPVAARGILTRINPEGLKALRQLALDRDTTVQALMIEAANDLLRKYRRRPVAQTAR